MKRFLLFFSFFLFHVVGFAQEPIVVEGTITDAEGTPLPGVNVIEQGTSNGVITNFDGEFSIKAAEDAVLEISYIGFVTKKIEVNGQSRIDVALTVDSEQLSEVLVVGYGTQISKKVTGAVSQIESSELEDMPVANVGQRLQGKLPGVQINQNNGTPGAEMSFRIRGAASINAGNDPLIVIDGFPSSSGLQSLSPDEIESISVLKDAAASALYGSRAANGVILVTTKQAKEGQKSLDISVYAGIQSVGDRGKPDLMGPVEFAQFKKEYYEDAARYEGYTGGVPEIYQNPSQYAGQEATDWFDILLRDAPTTKYNLAYRSGTDDFKSATNLNYTRQEGVMLNSYDERFTARTNNVYTASDYLTLGANLSLSYNTNQVVAGLGNGRNIIQNAYLMDPTLRHINPDGTYPIAFAQPGMFPNPNYYLVLKRRENETKSALVTANLFAEVNIFEGLKFKTTLNASTDNSINRRFNPSTVQGGLGAAPPRPATGSYNTSNFTTWLSENTLNYNTAIGDDHNIDLLIGYSAQKFSSESSGINGSEFPDDNIHWINAANTRIGNTAAGQSSLLSYYGRLNYDFKDKYLVSMSFRRDGSSKFGSSRKYGNFPSVSVGWVASDEKFIQAINPIDFLKLRGSYGVVGNNNIGDFTYLAPINTYNYIFDDQLVTGKALGGIPNDNLTWETTTGYNFGLDLELFDRRVSFTYNYYWKKTDEMLYAIDIPVQSGFSSITSNVGRFDFWGHEFSVSTDNLRGGQLTWNTNFNISFDRNLVKKLGTSNAPIGGYQEYWDDNRTAVGNPIGLFYGYINTGVYMTQEEFDTQPVGATSEVGTARFKDVNGDGVIDSNDRTYIGDPNPDFIYGLTNTLAYRNFDFSLVLAGTVGNDIADDAYQSTENIDGVFNVRRAVADRWRSLENPGAGIYPRTKAGTTADFRNFTSRQVFDGSYLMAKNITLGYTLPTNKFVKNARIYLSVQNAFTITNYPGMNPEVGISGLNGLNQGRDFTSYPIARTISLGTNIKF